MVDFKHEVFNIISGLTGHDNIITLNVAFVDFVDDLETGLFLSQLIYWSDRGTRKDGFIFKSDKEWHEELRLSKYAVRKAKKKLKEMGILETKVKKAYGNPTTHYKLNKNEFVSQFTWFLRNQQNESSNTTKGKFENTHSLTDTTTDVKTDTKKNKGTKLNLALSFSQYLNTKELNNDVVEVIDYYFSSYNRYTRKIHPRLKPEQWDYVVDNLFYVADENTGVDFDLSVDDLIVMIDKHFETKYQNCDYNILHFMSDGVRVHRMYEVAY